jgi:pimeloyl-ACP methyl ester carboxylesterase
MLDLAEQVCEDAALVFGGMSMGAATALHLACAAPERVAALVLVLPPTAWETRVRQVRIYRVMARVVKLLGPRALKALLGLSKQPELPWTRGRMHKAMAAAVGRVSIPHLVNALKGAALSDLPSQEAVSELTMPTLILAWENDFTHPLSSAHRLQELMPHAELKIARSDEEVEHWVDDIQAFMRANLG